jgi:hypothetical protein
MPAAAPRRTRDGVPLPELTEAHRDVLSARPGHVLQRRRSTAILEAISAALLRRDIHAVSHGSL